jgi:hypothetical protein
MIWVLLRSLTRPMVEVPVKANALEQVVPFWTGFNKIHKLLNPLINHEVQL